MDLLLILAGKTLEKVFFVFKKSDEALLHRLSLNELLYD